MNSSRIGTLLDPRKWFNRLSDFVFGIILVFISITLLIGAVRLFLQIGKLVSHGGITGGYLYIFSDVLTLFILIELSRSLVEYFDKQRLKLTYIIDAGIVFVLRDIMILLFEHKIASDQIYAFSALLLVLGLVRVSTTPSFERMSGARSEKTR